MIKNMENIKYLQIKINEKDLEKLKTLDIDYLPHCPVCYDGQIIYDAFPINNQRFIACYVCGGKSYVSEIERNRWLNKYS